MLLEGRQEKGRKVMGLEILARSQFLICDLVAVGPVSSSVKGSLLFSSAPTKSGLSLHSNYGNSNGY